MTEDWNIEAGNDLAALRASGIVRRGNKVYLTMSLTRANIGCPVDTSKLARRRKMP